jgi:hypothetical protein
MRSIALGDTESRTEHCHRPDFCYGHPFRINNAIRKLQSLVCLMVAAIAMFSCTHTNAQTRVVELTVFAGPRNPAGAQQSWTQVLSRVGADRVSSLVRSDVKPSISEEKFGGSTIVSVKGVLENGHLRLPGRKFSRSETSAIADYLQRLRNDSADIAMAEKKAFGLTQSQLGEVHELLSSKVSVSTTGMRPDKAVQNLLNDARLRARMDTDITIRLSKGKSLVDERMGLSVGTSLASILIESNAGLIPYRRAGDSIEFRIASIDQEKETWPIGWPSDEAPVALEPRLFQRQDIRIEHFPLGDALTAVAKRCGANVLFNRKAILDHGIDLAKTDVSFNRKQVTYMVTFGKLLRQSQPAMDIEIRIDEAGSPFAWIDVRE